MNVSEKEMLETIDAIRDFLEGVEMLWGPSDVMENVTLKKVDSIRRLIEEHGELEKKVGEWQRKAKYAYNGTSGERIDLIVEIRDFRKEKK